MTRVVGLFEIDMVVCPHCGGTLKIVAAIEHPPVIVTHLGDFFDRLHIEAEAKRQRASAAR